MGKVSLDLRENSLFLCGRRRQPFLRMRVHSTAKGALSTIGVPDPKCLAGWVCPNNRLHNLNMDKQDAIEMRDHGVKAIRDLMGLFKKRESWIVNPGV